MTAQGLRAKPEPISLSPMGELIEDSPTLAAGALFKRTKPKRDELGLKSFNFTLGQPHKTVPFASTLGEFALAGAGYTTVDGVPEISGIPSLQAQIAARLQKTHRIAFDESNICLTGGGTKAALYHTACVISRPGDKIGIPTPTWGSYVEIFKAAGLEVILIPTYAKDGFKLTEEQLAEVLVKNPDLRLLLIGSPSNPTGSCYTRQEFERLAARLYSHPTPPTVVLDEIYFELFHPGVNAVSFAEVAPDLPYVIVSGFAKMFGLCGWRLGFYAGPANVKDALKARLSQLNGNPPHPEMLCIQAHRPFLKHMDFPASLAVTYAGNANLARQFFADHPDLGIKVPYLPQGAFYTMLDIEELLGRRPHGINSTKAFETWAIGNGFGVVHGEAFYLPNSVRLSLACEPELLQDGLDHLAKILRA